MASGGVIGCRNVLVAVILTVSLMVTSTWTLTLDDVGHACLVSDDSRSAVCRQRNLTAPPQHLAAGTEILDLSRNRIRIVIPEYWTRYPNLRHLNLSSCGLSILQDHSFSGLSKLLLLDLTNNPVLAYLPEKVFSPLINLQTLVISGEVVPPEVLIGLHNLEVLTMTFRNRPPLELSRLPKLKVLTFAFSQLEHSGGRLTADMLEHLANSSIEELAFHGCQLSRITHGAFDNFARLKLLNFACNGHLQISNVIDVLSTMKATSPVEGLILDGTQNTFTILGQQEANSCMPAWKYMKRLSLRNANLYGFNVYFISNCLRNLESVALGFNNPVFLNLNSARSFYGGSNALKLLFQYASTNLGSIDASYLLHDDQRLASTLSGCKKEQAWIPNNWELFPPSDPTRLTSAIDDYPMPRWSTMLSNEQCSIVQLPRNLTYLNLQNIAGSHRLFSTSGYSCVVVLTNSLRHLNMSGSKLIGSKRYLGSIYGLHHLDTLDLTDNDLVEFNFTELVNFPSLSVLMLKNNRLLSLSAIGRHKHLSILDLSDNFLTSIPRGMFSGLASLGILNLRGNQLSRIDFVTKNLITLSDLDMGHNELRSVEKDDAYTLDNLFSEKDIFTLALDHNPFQCTCSSIEFVGWLHVTRTAIREKEKLTCVREGETRTYITKIDISTFKCRFTGRQ